MKCVILCAVAIFSLTLALPEEYSRVCIYTMGRCAEECPVGTHAYSTDCGSLMPEATCRNPRPELDRGGPLCDYSSCYCDAPTVRDERTDRCVTIDKCT